MKLKTYRYKIIFILGIVVGLVLILNQANTIYGGDAGDLVSAIITKGIPHPPGYPLYTHLGILLYTFIPFGTPAWRVGFLSSIPSIFTIIVLFDFLIFLTKKTYFSLIAVFTLSFSYLFWLYSSVVEVFSLNNLFLILILSLSFRFARFKNVKYLYLAAFIFGLSLAHHHIIVFLIPSSAYLILRNRKKISGKILLKSFLYFLSGFMSYLYPFISSLSSSPINWMGKASLSNFLDLVTRAGYGTFMSSPSHANDPYSRFFQIVAFFRYLLEDFRILGVFLIIIGLIYLFKKNRQGGVAVLLGIISYLFFLFYASFPLSNNFTVATFERFMLPLYVLFIIPLAYGFLALTDFLERKLKMIITAGKLEIVKKIIYAMFFIYPLSLFFLNFPKISILKNDYTAENLGRDILNSTRGSGILFLMNDSPIFDTQYVYFSESGFPNVRLIHYPKLFTPYYSGQLKSEYPDLEVVDATVKNSSQIIDEFIDKNYSRFPIYSKLSLPVKNGKWIPYGLVFRYFKNDDLPDPKTIFNINENLWNQYHDPMSGSLSKYQNMMLSEVPEIYAIAHEETGYWEITNGYLDKAAVHFGFSEKLSPKDIDSYNLLAMDYIKMNKCTRAQEELEKALKIEKDNTDTYFLLMTNAGDCMKDASARASYQKIYESKLKDKETPLKKL